MAYSLYDAAVTPCAQQLGALAGIIDKAAAHCAANKIEESALLQDRLYPDMFCLARQIRQSADFAMNTGGRLAGFYKTPDIHWDQAAMKGEPYFYFSYGAAVAEVAVDTLTGEARVLSADLVQDCGRSLNPAVDLGQIEGGFVQGLGWLTCEELWWDREGRLRTVGPSTYKIPGSRDVPPHFNVRILEDMPARAATIYGSKGIGEPPIQLATAVWTALKDAIGSTVDHQVAVSLDAPATPERILMALGRLAASF